MNLPKINSTKLLVEDIPEIAEKTASGIFIPTTVKIPTLSGKVVLKGEGTPDIKIIYEVGDTVLFHPQAGNKFIWDKKEYRLLDVSDIFLGGS